MSEERTIGVLALATAISLAAFVGLRVQEGRALARGPQLAWRSWDEGVAEATRSGKRMVVDFGASWCRPCQLLEQKTLREPSVARMLERDFVTVRVDVDEEPARAEQYHAQKLPTLTMLTPDQSIVDVHWGYMSPRELRKWLAKASKRGVAELPRKRE